MKAPGREHQPCVTCPILRSNQPLEFTGDGVCKLCLGCHGGGGVVTPRALFSSECIATSVNNLMNIQLRYQLARSNAAAKATLLKEWNTILTGLAPTLVSLMRGLSASREVGWMSAVVHENNNAKAFAAMAMHARDSIRAQWAESVAGVQGMSDGWSVAAGPPLAAYHLFHATHQRRPAQVP